ncbi:MAG: GldG family protein, partial [Kiritimatiellia bacterium]|nr:GldG family protein [Kiritimatiellia bacterium]
MKNRMWIRRFQGGVGWLLLAGLLTGLTALISSLGWRVDVTSDRLYTLSDGARGLIEGLPRDVTLKLYVSRGAEAPVPLKRYAGRVEDLLREMVRLGDGRLSVETYDPRPDSTEEEWARRYGVIGQPVHPLDPDSAVYLGLVAVSGAREATLPFLSPQDESRLEYHLVRLLTEVGSDRKPRIGIWSSLPIAGPVGPMVADAGSAWIFLSELESLYDLDILDAKPARIPEDLTALILIHPKEFSEEFLFDLDQYILGGGRLIAFVDPFCLADLEEMARAQTPGLPNAASDLNRLTAVWGARLETGRIAADSSAATALQAASGRAERQAGWMTLRADHMESGDVVTAPLDRLMIPFGGAFRLTPVEGIRQTVLLRTSPSGGWLDAMALLMGSGRTRDPLPEPDPLPLAVRLVGRFPTAFPAGRPGGISESAAETAE